MEEIGPRVLIEEIDDSIAALQTNCGIARCPAHDSLARANITTLRCIKVIIQQQQQMSRITAVLSIIISTVVSGGITAWERLKP